MVAENYTDENFGLPELCLLVGMSRSELFRKMSALIRTSPSAFIRSYRLHEATLKFHLISSTTSYRNTNHLQASMRPASDLLLML